MPAYTIVTTSAVQGGDTAEVNTLTDDFANDSEALGYARRMADEMIEMAHQLLLDFDYSNVGVYDGDLIDEDITPDHASLIGVWVLDEDGSACVTAEEFREGATEVEPS
ncbi:MAG: hypothetical protein KKC40_07975 [Alphaproteobacteria bacterium]|nr:hypothetical protein [Alphaproteobacteria bacterium]MBU2348067.1 hypothetical protein [Alphaproteobacteria bacterium]